MKARGPGSVAADAATTMSHTAPLDQSSVYGSIVQDQPENAEEATRLVAAFDARYERRDLLGVGGMGEVSLLFDRRMQREVAGKFLHVSGSQRPSIRARFLREARIQGQLDHPSIVPVYDVGLSPEGRPFFTMKRIYGLTLREILADLRRREPGAEERFPLSRLLAGFASVCLTVAFAHDRGIIHRDLKPANIILGDFGEAYVLDWGVARVERPAPGDPQDVDASLVGSPGYMAPEQIGTPSDRHDRMVDVYALGAVLFELLTLDPLHGTAGREAQLRSTLDGVVGSPAARAPQRNIPPELDAICQRATAFLPARRFHSVLELHAAIERYLHGERDVELRRSLAEAYATQAKQAVDDAAAGAPENEETFRSRAVAELGRALALDPGNDTAARQLSRLLVKPPRQLPRGAQAELAKLEVKLWRQAALVGTAVASVCFGALPLMLWMGVREWPLFIAAWLLVGCTVALCCYRAFSKERTSQSLELFMFLLATLSAVIQGSEFGPLLVAPMWIALFTAGLVIVGPRRHTALKTAVALAALVLPFLLEILGIVPSSYEFSAGRMCVLPRMLALPQWGTYAYLLGNNVGSLLISVVCVAHFRKHLEATQEAIQVHAWHLGQLVPAEAGDLGAGAGGGRPTRAVPEVDAIPGSAAETRRRRAR